MIQSKAEARREFESSYPGVLGGFPVIPDVVYDFNPLRVLAAREERDEMCLAHTRWIVKDQKCLTPETKYDSKNKECRVTHDPRCAAILREYHQGFIDLAETKRQLAEMEATHDDGSWNG